MKYKIYAGLSGGFGGATLLFPEDFMNDCFKEYAYKDTREDEFCESEELCVRQYLRDVFPQYESILVKISW